MRARACGAALAFAAACASCRQGRSENPLGGCVICHVDVQDELAGGAHLAAGVECVRCHGRSVAHSADENNEVKPDRLFTKKDIDAFCGGCHDCPRPDDPPSPRPKVCTVCHGVHRTVMPGRRSGTARENGRPL